MTFDDFSADSSSEFYAETDSSEITNKVRKRSRKRGFCSKENCCIKFLQKSVSLITVASYARYQNICQPCTVSKNSVANGKIKGANKKSFLVAKFAMFQKVSLEFLTSDFLQKLHMHSLLLGKATCSRLKLTLVLSHF